MYQTIYRSVASEYWQQMATHGIDEGKRRRGGGGGRGGARFASANTPDPLQRRRAYPLAPVRQPLQKKHRRLVVIPTKTGMHARRYVVRWFRICLVFRDDDSSFERRRQHRTG